MSRPLSSASPLLSLSDVGLRVAHSAGAIDILHHISLQIHAGESVAIIGPSGSGKTSLMMLMAGLERPTSGEIALHGTAMQHLSEEALTNLRRQHVGIVFQSFHLIPSMTALENVSLPLELAHGADGATISARAAQALEAVGLGHRVQHYPSEMSGGEQQRVAIARACVGRPSLLLADEPTGNLDQETGKHITDLLFSLHATHGITLVLVTHDAALAARCGRIVHIQDGCITQTTTQPNPS